MQCVLRVCGGQSAERRATAAIEAHVRRWMDHVTVILDGQACAVLMVTREHLPDNVTSSRHSPISFLLSMLSVSRGILRPTVWGGVSLSEWCDV